MLLPVISILLLITSIQMWVTINSSVLSYQSTVMEKTNTQQFLLAEAALHAGEFWLKNAAQLPHPVETCSVSPCILQARYAGYLPNQSISWWQASHNLALVPVFMNISEIYNAFYVVEQFLESSNTEINYYRITAWALLHPQSSPTILQSVWLKSFSLNKRLSWRAWS